MTLSNKIPISFVRREPDGTRIIDLSALFAVYGVKAARAPRSIRILAEAAARAFVDGSIAEDELARLVQWSPTAHLRGAEIRFPVGRLVLQDASGLPLLADLAALRSAVARSGRDPRSVMPSIPITMVIDHSVIVDSYREPGAFERNLDLEFTRNAERYNFARWAEQAFDNLTIVPPGNGIVHQIHMEQVVEVVTERNGWRFFDTVIGTDSHTTMINGLGVLGWGVGGIEAEGAVLGELQSLAMPEVVGVELFGELRHGACATDAALALTKFLRQSNVVGRFVEFFGAGVASLSIADRSTIANMAPEYGATCALFPLDATVLAYLVSVGRDETRLQRVKAFLNRQGFEDAVTDTLYSRNLAFDLSRVTRNVAGPSRPQDVMPVADIREQWVAQKRNGVRDQTSLQNGDVVIAAITSCTNTANPRLMITAGLLARNAERRGLTVDARVKTSLAPGSRLVANYLQRLDLLAPLGRLGFGIVAFGCTTCVGNSGDLAPELEEQITVNKLSVVAVLSGNRNFEARIHPLVRANYLMSPALVVAFALAGSVGIDVEREPLSVDPAGRGVCLDEIWPSEAEIEVCLKTICLHPNCVPFESERWRAIDVKTTALWPWDDNSSYFLEPPFFDADFARPVRELVNARPLLVLGDGVTTDHISPVGTIARKSDAASYLEARGVAPRDFNTYAARRGNHDLMVRGTFANIRLRNNLAGGREGPWTRLFPSGTIATVHDAAAAYRAAGVDMVVLAGETYGNGSARDWAAKGTRLLGISAVIARSFERIHRSNLVRTGVVPLQILDGEVDYVRVANARDIVISTRGLESINAPSSRVTVQIQADEYFCSLDCIARIETRTEAQYLAAGGLYSHALGRALGMTGFADDAK